MPNKKELLAQTFGTILLLNNKYIAYCINKLNMLQNQVNIILTNSNFTLLLMLKKYSTYIQIIIVILHLNSSFSTFLKIYDSNYVCNNS